MKIFAERLKELRKSQNLTQEQLAVKLEISRSALGMYETGKREPDFTMEEKVADFFNVSIDYLRGKQNFIQCPICFQSYDPLNIKQNEEHNTFHDKFINAQLKYGDILVYSEADRKRSNSIRLIRDPSLSIAEKIAAYNDYLKYSFMISIWENGFTLNHEDFKLFAQNEVAKLQPDELISEELCNNIRKKYEQASYEKIIQFTSRDERDITKDLDSLMKKLSSKEYGPAAYDGEELSEDSVSLFKDELELALRRLKLINKEKYNPNKNKK